jgi:hypothetical protein
MQAMLEDEEAIAQELLPQLQEQFPDIAGQHLIKFLRWKQDVKRGVERINTHQKWRKDNPFAFDSAGKPPLRITEDPMLQRLLEAEIICTPDGMFSKQGCPVIVGRLRNNLMAEHGSDPQDVARMFFYTIDQTLETKLAAQQNGVCVFHDLTGLSRSNLHPMIPKLLISGLIGTYPIKIKGIYIYNAPWFFKAIFKVVSLMLPSKLRARIVFLKKLEDLREYIDQDMLLEEHGGQRHHDQKDWVARSMERERSGEFHSLSELVQ